MNRVMLAFFFRSSDGIHNGFFMVIPLFGYLK